MQRLGLFGGTFNPPHKGHIYIAREAMRLANLQKMLFIPCGTPPHKEVWGNVDKKHRLGMTKLAISGYNDFEVSDIEIMSEDKSYTVNTLEKLTKIYPDVALCFVVGGDSLRDMEDWYHPEKIFGLSEIIALNRGGIDREVFQKSADFYRKKYDAKITEVDISPMEVSSSDIRKKLILGEDVSDLVPCGVLEYIEKFKLYRDNV